MVLPRDPKKRAAALAERPRPQLPERRAYPDPGAEPVPVVSQGPNEQSIVASGMTVEEWQLKHPGQPLGPNPEDVGQMTTDPVDGSDPEPDPLFPGTFSSVDPDGSKTRAENEDPTFPGDGSQLPEPPTQGALVISTPTEGATVPAVHDIVGGGAMAGATVELWASDRTDSAASTTTAGPNGAWGFTGDTPAHPGPITWTVKDGTSEASVSVTVAGEEPEPESDDETPWASMSRHADLDEFVTTEELEIPDDWDRLTVAQKKAWLDESSEDV